MVTCEHFVLTGHYRLAEHIRALDYVDDWYRRLYGTGGRTVGVSGTAG
jgi:hypothetical protein